MAWRIFIHSFIQILLFSFAQAAEKGTWTIKHYQGVPFRILLPINYRIDRAYPVLLFLHGQGQDTLAPNLPLPVADEHFNSASFRKSFPAIVIAPQCPGSRDTKVCSWGGAHPEPKNGELWALGITQWTMKNYSVDPKRIYVTGVSLGGNGAWDMIWRYKNIFAAALPVAGATWYWKTVKMKELLQTPIWAAHGRLDQIVPPSYDRANYAAVLALGGLRMRYTEYPQHAHNVWDEVYSDHKYFEWLFSQRR